MTPRKKLEWTPGLKILVALSVIGAAAIAYRFIFGLGAATNLTDGYAWGFLTGVNKLTQIALAAGGFVMAGVIHIFGGHRMHGVARSAILAGLLGYILFIAALIVDLGRPWNLPWAIISWNHHSPMFEVAWCVMMYSFVLVLEFLPVVLEKFDLKRAMVLFHQWVPALIIVMLAFFTFVMTSSVLWAAIVAAILVAWEMMMRAGIMPRDLQMPLLLIMAGIMFSTLHQSTLGGLFLIVDKMSPIWYSPFLPIIFFVSAVMVGPSMVVLERLLTPKIRGREPEMDLLLGISKAMPYVIGFYILVRLADLVGRGVVMQTVSVSMDALWFWLEMHLLIISLALYANPDAMKRKVTLLLASIASVVAITVHRVGVTMIAMDIPEYPTYYPMWLEYVVSIGLIAMGLLAFRLIVQYFPVYEEQLDHEAIGRSPMEQAALRAARSS
ncbi:MAG: NrfD/PsrC family molybdoenzyme membrane anchor subunit [bacterium]